MKPIKRISGTIDVIPGPLTHERWGAIDRLDENGQQQVLDLWPMVREIAGDYYYIHKNRDEVESAAQWGLVWAVIHHDPASDESLADFCRLIMCQCARYLPRYERKVWSFSRSDEWTYDPEDKRSRLAFNTIESQIDLTELQRMMSPQEWTVVQIVIMDDEPIINAAWFLSLTMNRTVELYNSAAEKIREWAQNNATAIS